MMRSLKSDRTIQKMKFAEDHNEANYKITGYETKGIMINERLFQQPLIVSPTTLISDWKPNNIKLLTAEDFEPFYELKAEVILLGTGEKQQFPNNDVLKQLAKMQIGFEIMDTQAACRTFNIIMSEGRNVVAGIFLGYEE